MVSGVIGLDLSLRSAAAVYIPAKWSCSKKDSWSEKALPRVVAGYELKGDDPGERIDRICEIVEAIESFVRRFESLGNNDQLLTRLRLPQLARLSVYQEDYAFGLAGRSGMRIAELGGAVKQALRSRLNLVVKPVNISTARKYLLGDGFKMKGSAALALNTLKAAGASFRTSDEADAFIVANYGRTEVGLPGIALG